MPSQFMGLMIGYSGLSTYQATLNVVGNNAANVETEGYSRQVMNQKASDALRTYTGYGMAGTGVTAVSIDQLRNTYYDLKYRNNQADLGRYSVHKAYMTQIEDYFADDTTVDGFNTLYTENFFNALEELNDDPGTETARTNFLGAAKSIMEYFNNMSAKLSDMQTSLNQEVKSQVERINKIAQEIASLNQQINVIELAGSAANELRDQRNLLVDELSGIVDVEVTEVPVLDESYTDGKQHSLGTTRFTLAISNGNNLVEGYRYNTLECVERSNTYKNSQMDVDGIYDIYWSGTGGEFSPLAINLSGSLKGLLELRDGNNDYALGGTVASDAAAGDTSVTMTYTGRAESLKEVINELNIGAAGTITLSNTKYTYESWTASEDSSTGAITFTFSGLAPFVKEGSATAGILRSLDEGDSVVVGKNVDYQGIPYYQTQMNNWVRQFAYCIDKIQKYGDSSYSNYSSPDYTSNLYGNDMTLSFFQWKDRVSGDMIDLNEEAVDSDLSISSTDTTAYFNLTAANVKVNPNIINDVGLFSTTSSDGDVNLSDNDVVSKMVEVMTNKTTMDFRGCSSEEFLKVVLSDIALGTKNAKTFTSISENLENTIGNQKLSVMGVDDDEVAMDLIKFQNAYNLNSKIIQTMTEIYDRLILQTGV